MPTGKPNLLTPFRKNIAHGQDFLTAMRGFDKSHEACLTPPAGATLGHLVWFYAGKTLRVVGREVLYALWTPMLILMQATVVIVVNVLALIALLWFIGLI